MSGGRLSWRTERWVLVTDAVALAVFGFRAIVDADSRIWTIPLTLLVFVVLTASLRQRAAEGRLKGPASSAD